MSEVRSTTRTEYIQQTTNHCVLCHRPGCHLNNHREASPDAPPETVALARLQVALQEMYDLGAPMRLVEPLEEALRDIWGRLDEASIWERENMKR